MRAIYFKSHIIYCKSRKHRQVHKTPDAMVQQNFSADDKVLSEGGADTMGQESAFHYCSISSHSAGLTPNLLMRGRETRLPAELMLGKTTSEGVLYNYGEYVENIRQRLLRAHEVARKHLRQAAHHQRETYDIRTSQHHYEEGQLVWYLNETRNEGIYQSTYLGPLCNYAQIL